MEPRVLYCIPAYRYGGIETNTGYICKFAAQEGYKKFGLCVEEQDVDISFDEYIKAGWKIYQVDRGLRFHPIRYCKEMRKIMRDGGYNIVHSFSEKRSPIYFLAAKLNHINVRVYHPRTTRLDGNKFIQKIEKILVHVSTSLSTKHCACSNNVGKFMFGNKNFLVLNDAIDTDKFTYEENIRTKVREALGLSDDIFTIGHVGRFCEAKNHKFILEIFKKVLEEKPTSKLVLIGDGPLMDITKKTAKELEIENNIMFLGRRKDVAELYQGMDLLVFPSIYEGYPNVVMEAQSSGLKCVISSNITSDVVITDNVIQLSLEDDASKWARNIIEFSDFKERKSNKKEIINGGHDALTETKRLFFLYEKWLKESV